MIVSVLSASSFFKCSGAIPKRTGKETPNPHQEVSPRKAVSVIEMFTHPRGQYLPEDNGTPGKTTAGFLVAARNRREAEAGEHSSYDEQEERHGRTSFFIRNTDERKTGYHRRYVHYSCQRKLLLVCLEIL